MRNLMVDELSNPPGKRASTDRPVFLLFAGSRSKVQLLTDRHDRQCRLLFAQAYLCSLDPELTISTYEGRTLLISQNASNGRVDDNDDPVFFASDSNRLSLASLSQSR